MNKTPALALALAAGILGGLLTRYMAPPAAFAQGQAPITKEIRAQSFTLVDSSDHSVGTFTFEPSAGGAIDLRQRRIVLRDANGREIWSAGGSAVRPLSER